MISFEGKLRSSLKSASVCASALFLGSLGLQAQILLIDPSTTVGTGTLPSPNVPYAVTNAEHWNRGNSGTYGNAGLVYSDGSAASGVTVVTDSLENITGGAAYNFSAPSTGNSGNAGISGVFSSNPVNNGVFASAASNVGYGGIAMKVGGLSFGTYDVYIVAAYVGTTSANWAGGSTPARYNVWGFSGANQSVFNTGTFGPVNDLLENSTRTSWVQGDNFSKLTVTLDATNPYLYVVSEGALNDSLRGWLDSVQIVPVPEPSTYALLGLGLGFLFFLRRRNRA